MFVRWFLVTCVNLDRAQKLDASERRFLPVARPPNASRHKLVSVFSSLVWACVQGCTEMGSWCFCNLRVTCIYLPVRLTPITPFFVYTFLVRISKLALTLTPFGQGFKFDNLCFDNPCSIFDLVFVQNVCFVVLEHSGA